MEKGHAQLPFFSFQNTCMLCATRIDSTFKTTNRSLNKAAARARHVHSAGCGWHGGGWSKTYPTSRTDMRMESNTPFFLSETMNSCGRCFSVAWSDVCPSLSVSFPCPSSRLRSCMDDGFSLATFRPVFFFFPLAGIFHQRCSKGGWGEVEKNVSFAAG